jgi:hypothetical protein
VRSAEEVPGRSFRVAGVCLPIGRGHRVASREAHRAAGRHGRQEDVADSLGAGVTSPSLGSLRPGPSRRAARRGVVWTDVPSLERWPEASSPRRSLLSLSRPGESRGWVSSSLDPPFQTPKRSRHSVRVYRSSGGSKARIWLWTFGMPTTGTIGFRPWRPSWLSGSRMRSSRSRRPPSRQRCRRQVRSLSSSRRSGMR